MTEGHDSRIKVLHSFWPWSSAKILKCFRNAKLLKFLEVDGEIGLESCLWRIPCLLMCMSLHNTAHTATEPTVIGLFPSSPSHESAH